MRAGPPLSMEATALRDQILSKPSVFTLTPKAVLNAGRRQLFVLQKEVLLGTIWGVIDVPDALQTVKRIPPLDLWKYLPKGVDRKSAQAKRIILELTRFAVAMAALPSRTGILMRHTTIYGNVCAIARQVRRHTSIGRSKSFWPTIVVQDVATTSGPSYVPLFSVLRHYHRMGAIADTATDRPRVLGTQGPRDRAGEPEHTQKASAAVMSRPYSDELVSAAGWAAIAMIRIVGPTLLDAVEAASKVKGRTKSIRSRGNLASSAAYKMNAEARDPIIANWDWRGPDGRKLKAIPIKLGLERGRQAHHFSWPPTTYNQALLLITALQGAHAFPVALSIGPRNGELLSMKVGCLRRVTNAGDVGTFQTWKMQPAGGRSTEAPVPSLVVEAIKQQERLGRILKRHYKVVSDSLWISTRHPGSLPALDYMMDSFFKAVSVDHLVTDGGVNVHRFRKTLARIVALALVHAPKILMDVFGHRDEEITVVRYMLADPTTLAEVQTVVREMVVLMAADAVTKVDEIEGAGAGPFRERVKEYATRLGKKALEPQNLLEFARALTQDGSSWAVIAPGIICTNFTEGGLCNKGQGKANPHYCSPLCENQLEIGGSQKEVTGVVTKAIESIDYVLGLAQEAIADGDTMLLAQFQGQIRSLLHRWKEVDRHFSGNRLLKTIMIS